MNLHHHRKLLSGTAFACTLALAVSVPAITASASSIQAPNPSATPASQTAPSGSAIPSTPQTVFEAEWAYETNSSYPGTDAGVEELWYNNGDRAVQATDTSYIGSSSGENIVWRSDGTQVNCEFYSGSTCNTSWLDDAGYTSYAEGFIDYLNTNFVGITASF